MKTITKKALVKSIAHKKRMDPKNVKMIIDGFMDLVKSNLEEGNRLEFRDFGVFKVVQRKAKVGRNPRFPEKSILIPPKKSVKFSPGQKMKSLVSD